MDGGAGNDKLYGDGDSDKLYGEAGNDRLWGGAGSDTYYFNGQGFDVINDGVFNSGAARTGTVYDKTDVLDVTYTSTDWHSYRLADHLIVCSKSDYADSVLETAIMIQNFFQGGHYVIEYLQPADGPRVNIASEWGV